MNIVDVLSDNGVCVVVGNQVRPIIFRISLRLSLFTSPDGSAFPFQLDAVDCVKLHVLIVR